MPGFVFESIGTSEIILILFLLLMVVGIITAVVFVVKSASKSSIQMKKCPFCAELIQPEAIVCRFCGRDLLTQ